ncbi:ATP-binding protein [Streptomyces sp. NPDC019224]|uniref:ATP-binding protein n=1 Tax=Streptomyces sp. NPDC019224 TaxID=3154484 RepID=UPI0033E0F5D1
MLQTSFEIDQRPQGEGISMRDALRVGATRRIAGAFLSLHQLSNMAFPVALILSELVTNAIQHSSGTEVTVTMQCTRDLLYAGVTSNVPGNLTLREAGDDAESGRGLLLMAATVSGLDGTWGVSDDQRTVWCLLPAEGGVQ